MCTVMTALLPLDYYLSLTLQVSEGLVYVYDPPLHSRGNFLDYYVELDRRLLDYIVGLDTEINELVTGSVCDLVQCKYRSVPLIHPPILYTTSSPKRGGGVFSSTQLVSIIRPLKKFCYVYGTAKVHVHSYKSTNDRQYCSWSSCVVSLHRR